MLTKVCSHCKQEKEFSLFNKCKTTKDGLQNYCKECAAAKRKRLRKENPEKTKEAWNKYRSKMKQDKRYRLSCLLNSSKARAAEKQREHTLTLEDLLDLYPKDNCCPVYGFELIWGDSGFRETSPSIDRIDSSKGYTKDNVQIISWKANRLKSYATLEDLEILVSFMKQAQ